jgi:hypothetical protein
MIIQTILLFVLLSCYSINHTPSCITYLIDKAADLALSFSYDADKIPDSELPEIQENDYSKGVVFGVSWFDNTVEVKDLNLPNIETQKYALNFLSMRLLL